MAHELRSRGWRVATVEWRSAHRPTVLADVVRWERDRSREYTRTRGAPDAVIAGPPCTTRSKRSWSRHREVGAGTGKPTSVAARYADEREVVAAWSFIQRCMQHNPSGACALENPDTVAWAQVPVLQPHLGAGEFKRVQYGDYGWPLLKPTAIVTNLAAPLVRRNHGKRCSAALTTLHGALNKAIAQVAERVRGPHRDVRDLKCMRVPMHAFIQMQALQMTTRAKMYTNIATLLHLPAPTILSLYCFSSAPAATPAHP